MNLYTITEYWKHWVFKASQDDPFTFLKVGEQDQDEEDQDSGDQDGEDQGQDDGGNDGDGEVQTEELVTLPPHMTIDDQVLPPILCQGTSSDRTKYLQSLVARRDKVSKGFRAVVELVDTMEVSYITYMTLPHLIEF